METISTSLPEKLPEEIRGLLVETRPLPPGVMFFEQRFTAASLAGRLLLGLALLAAAALLVPFGLVWLFSPQKNATVYDNNNLDWWFLAFGVVVGVAGWMLVASIPACLALGRRQKAGEQTRYGVFLTSEALVWRSYFDTTVIPRENFRGLQNRAVHYESANGEKSFTLPVDWIGAAEPGQAIRSWSQPSMPPVLPPPLPPGQ